MTLRDELAADAHQAWMDRMIADGVTSCPSNLTGEEQLVPFAQLSAPIQQYDYDLVNCIMDSLEKRGYSVTKMEFAQDFVPSFNAWYYEDDDEDEPQ